jgi:diguanylate cyclase (GGDEF)-like protein
MGSWQFLVLAGRAMLVGHRHDGCSTFTDPRRRRGRHDSLPAAPTPMMSASDVAFAMTAAMQGVLAVVWLLGARVPGVQRTAALYWAAFALASAISFVVLILARHGSTPLQTEGLRACGNIIGVVAFIALQRGVARFADRPAKARWDMLAIAIVVGASAIGLMPDGGRLRVGIFSATVGWIFVAMARSLHIHARDRLHLRRPWLLAAPCLCAAAAAWYRALTAVLSTTQLSNEAAASIGLNVRAAIVYMVLALAFHATLVSLVVARLLAELQHKARHDSLTGLLNRRAMEEAIGTQMQRGRRTGETHSLLMLDLDHFKSINDCFGHSIGDLVLQHVATVLQANVRKIDYVARVGGEEFLVLMPGASLDTARPAAQRLCEQLAADALQVQKTTVNLSASIGIAQWADTSEEMSRLLVRVDTALYQAKAQGRNRVFASDAANTTGVPSRGLTA